MNLYYLIAQLPTLDGISDGMPLPITEEYFMELCSRFLGKKALGELNRLSLMPPRKRVKSSSSLIEAWNDGERKLRFVLGKVRADKLKKSFDTEDSDISAELLQVAKTAVSSADPMEAERYLTRYRLDFLETLRPADIFSEDSLFYYCLKLKLMGRLRQFDEAKGEAAYRSIYTSIMSKDRLNTEERNTF